MKSNYEIDLDKANNVWGSNFSNPSEVFSTRIKLPDGRPVWIPTHMMGQSEETLRIIAYHSGAKKQQGSDEANQPDIARFLEPGEFAIGIKHHCPTPIDEPYDRLKWQCHHLHAAIRLKAADTVITLNKPQTFHLSRDNFREDRRQIRLFGNADYPMIYIKPTFPKKIDAQLKHHYLDNIRTWMMIINTFCQFPKRKKYNGKDPIGTYTVERVERLMYYLLQAMAGDARAKDWLDAWRNRFYCSEFIHGALNLGLHFPLNEKCLGSDYFALVKKQFESREFVSLNLNGFSHEVALDLAPADLEPITKYLKVHHSGLPPEVMPDPRLATRLYTWADLLKIHLVKMHPQRKLGNWVAACRLETLREMEPVLRELYSLEKAEADDPALREFQRFYQNIQTVSEKSWPDDKSYEKQLERPICHLRWLACKLPKAVDYIVSPQCFLEAADVSISGGNPGGLLGWQYLGHGLHSSLLRKVS